MALVNIKTDKTVGELFKKYASLDKNSNDQAFSYYEMEKLVTESLEFNWLLSRAYSEKDAAKIAFKTCDSNKDENITLDEINALMEEYTDYSIDDIWDMDLKKVAKKIGDDFEIPLFSKVSNLIK